MRNMKRYSKLKEGRYYGYHGSEFYFISDKVSKSKAITLIHENSKSTSESNISWIKERICEGANEKAIKLLSENPEAKMLILNKATYELVNVLK